MRPEDASGGSAPDRYLRPALIALAAAALLAASALTAMSLRLVLGGAGPEQSLPAERFLADGGVPVPASAQRCEGQRGTDAGQVRWCLPPSVTAPALTRWYADVLPAGRDSGRLRWCTEQHRSAGLRLAIWFDGESLLGYALPAQSEARAPVQLGDDGLAVAVFRAPALGCPGAARSSRQS